MSRVDFTAHAHPLLAVACAKCGAPVGAYCRRPSGHAGPFVGAHAERKAEADRVWEEQDDWPIVRTATGWAYAVGEEEDDPPAPRGRPRRPASPSTSTQGTLL